MDAREGKRFSVMTKFKIGDIVIYKTLVKDRSDPEIHGGKLVVISLPNSRNNYRVKQIESGDFEFFLDEEAMCFVDWETRIEVGDTVEVIANRSIFVNPEVGLVSILEEYPHDGSYIWGQVDSKHVLRFSEGVIGVNDLIELKLIKKGEDNMCFDYNADEQKTIDAVKEKAKLNQNVAPKTVDNDPGLYIGGATTVTELEQNRIENHTQPLDPVKNFGKFFVETTVREYFDSHEQLDHYVKEHLELGFDAKTELIQTQEWSQYDDENNALLTARTGQVR